MGGFAEVLRSDKVTGSFATRPKFLGKDHWEGGIITLIPLEFGRRFELPPLHSIGRQSVPASIKQSSPPIRCSRIHFVYLDQLLLCHKNYIWFAVRYIAPVANHYLVWVVTLCEDVQKRGFPYVVNINGLQYLQGNVRGFNPRSITVGLLRDLGTEKDVRRLRTRVDMGRPTIPPN